jgi:hypothetical protein
MGTFAPATYTTVVEVVVGATPGLATDGEPQTPTGVPDDVLGESEKELEMAPEPVPEVVLEQVLVEGAMITARVVAPSPSHGAPAPFSSAPHTATATGTAAGAGLEVVLGHPTPYALDDISLGEAVSTAHRALSHPRCEGEDLADERRHLQLWASMLKRMMVSEWAAA